MKKKHTYYLVCNNNGCTFCMQYLNKKEANIEATAHMNMYGHDVSIVKPEKEE